MKSLEMIRAIEYIESIISITTKLKVITIQSYYAEYVINYFDLSVKLLIYNLVIVPSYTFQLQNWRFSKKTLKFWLIYTNCNLFMILYIRRLNVHFIHSYFVKVQVIQDYIIDNITLYNTCNSNHFYCFKHNT